MLSSGIVTEAARGWLGLQRDLGGDDVILDQPLAKRKPEAAALPPSAATVPDEESGWRKGAPPIPGPGMVVNLPPLLLSSEPDWPTLDAVAMAIEGCHNCPLCEGRTKTVPGEGNPAARLMLVGEGPGESEDLSGRPFVGRAGDLLDKILAAIDCAARHGLHRQCREVSATSEPGAAARGA